MAASSRRTDTNGQRQAALDRARVAGTQGAGVFLVVLGSAVALAWAFGIEWLKHIDAELPPMVPTTTASFIAIGLAVFLISTPPDGWRRWAAGACAAAVVVITATALYEHWMGDPATIATFELSLLRAHGIMAMHTGLTLLLCSLAALSVVFRDPLGPRTTVVLAGAAFTLSLAALLGFVFGLQYVYGGRDTHGVAIHGAVGLAVASAALLFTRPQIFPASALLSAGVGGTLARRFMPFVVLAPMILGIAGLLAERAGLLTAQDAIAVVATVITILFAVVMAAAARRFDKSEAARAFAEQRFVAAFEGARTGLALLRIDGHDAVLTQVNQALCDVTGLAADKLEGTPIASLIAEEDVEDHRLLLDQLTSGAIRDFTFEGRLPRPGGGLMWVHMHTTVLDGRAGDGRVAYLQLEDITERKDVEHRLEYLASHDALTSLLNRRRFEEEVDRHVENCRRYGYEGSLVLMDLDNFKLVNDRLGHQTGDEVLRLVGAVLKERLRTTDIVARLGGDEFALLLPHGTVEQAELVCKDLLQRVDEKLQPVTGTIRTTASAGISGFRQGVTPSGAMARADIALYESKESGKGRVSMYSAASRDRAGDAVLPRRIRSALERGTFRLVVQPVVDLRSRAVRQYEVLLRMPEGSEADTPADVIFATAKRLGIAAEIDRWVLTQVMQRTDLLAHTTDDAELSLNLTESSLVSPSMADWLTHALRTSRVSPHRMTFEIPENVAMTNVEAVTRVAMVLRNAGCRVAIADFGAALATFSHLSQVPFDYVKIDGGLVTGLLEQPQNQAVIRGLVKTAETLGKTIIGEYVEDEDVAQLLLNLGVEYGQGFQLGKPAPVPPGAPANRP